MKLDSISEDIYNTNTMFNSILSTKIAIAKEKNIEVRWSVLYEFPQYMEMDATIMMSNVLDNAIDACCNQKNPVIDICVYYEEPYIFFNVKNTIDKSVISDNPELKTTKKNSKEHGIGLKSIKNTVEKYNGIYNVYEENNIFIVDVCFLDKNN